MLPSNSNRMDIGGVPEPPERGRLNNDSSVDGQSHKEPGVQEQSRAPLPLELRMRILQTYSDLVDARMESCLRLSRVLEKREREYR